MFMLWSRGTFTIKTIIINIKTTNQTFMKLRLYLTALLALTCLSSALGATVRVVMNSTSKTMSLVSKAGGESVDVGTPSGTTYTFSANPGTYVLTGYGSDGTTVNGTIELTVTDEPDQEFTVLTCTAYATNSGWTYGTDYTIDVTVSSREGETQVITLGNSTTAGRKTFLAYKGNSYYAQLIPSASHPEYMTLYKSATLTAGVNVTGAIPVGADYTVSIPADAQLALGIKFTHFTDFMKVEPVSTVTEGAVKRLTFHLADKQVYNYRTWREGMLTQGGYFTMSTDEAKRPALSFTDADYAAFGAKTIKHDVNWNQGYETGDIFVNINERGHLTMKPGETYEAHAMRSWELTDNSTNNYFIEPDFHYTVIGIDGKPSSGVIEIDDSDNTSAWATIKAVGEGTAIVLVTYDAIGLNYYSSADKKAYMGGEYWSAIWPENTAAYVVTVGKTEAAVVPNMVINEAYNTDTKKNAGKYVDAEHDVFYYLDSEDGALYTFKPEGAAHVDMARPVIGEQQATYAGFSDEGVTLNADGSYTLLLKEGRQIVRLTDAAGNATYQILTAKPCHREITNATREGSRLFLPGDKVKIQYSGLRHPSNKMAGIYNMSAYVTYNGIPNGSSLILGSGQYTFGSAPSAQAVTITIPADIDPSTEQEIAMTEGVIQVNGFGDPIGSHRLISRTAGRSANFTAIAHKTYFGQIPDIHIPLSAARHFVISTVCDVPDADITISYGGETLTADADGKYTGTYGAYVVTVCASRYEYYQKTFTIGDDAEGEQVFTIKLVKANNEGWDGKSVYEPVAKDGIYQISTSRELAWFADRVNSGERGIQGVLTGDIELAGYPWTPIGGTSEATAFTGTLDGQGHRVRGLYINSTKTYQGLFGYTSSATITGLTVEGSVTTTANYAAGIVAYAKNSTITRCTNQATVNAKQYAAGIAGYAFGATVIDRCQNNSPVTTTSTYAAGITAYLNGADASLTNCHNKATISGTGYVATIVSMSNAAAVISHNLSTGKLVSSATTTGNVRCATTAATAISDNYVIDHYNQGTAYETLVTRGELASGETAVALGEAWGQLIGYEQEPSIGGQKIYVTDNGYTNNNPAYDDIINFEDIDISNGLYDNGADGKGLFATAGDYSFMNYYDPQYGSWNGFAISATIDNDFYYYGSPSEFNSACGGAMESGQFAVGYYSEYNHAVDGQTPAIYATKAFRPEFVYVTNAASAYKSMMNGDLYAKKFTDDDYLLLTITGLTGDDKETGHVDFYLAKDGNIVNEWTMVDLTPLGVVDHVEFTMTSSDTSYGYMNTPAYFCLDNMKATLTDDIPTGIAVAVTADKRPTPVAIFSADGVRRDKMEPGVNIIRLSDGSTRKVVIRQ